MTFVRSVFIALKQMSFNALWRLFDGWLKSLSDFVKCFILRIIWHITVKYMSLYAYKPSIVIKIDLCLEYFSYEVNLYFNCMKYPHFKRPWIREVLNYEKQVIYNEQHRVISDQYNIDLQVSIARTIWKIPIRLTLIKYCRFMIKIWSIRSPGNTWVIHKHNSEVSIIPSQYIL